MRAVRWLLVILLVLHGLVHLMGTIGAWGIAPVQAQTGAPILPLAGFALTVLGFVWLAACLGLLASAVLLAFKRDAWAPVALAGVVLSQLAIVFWWTNAWRGTFANLLILAAIVWQLTMHGRLQVTSTSQQRTPHHART
jgi:hypothetical protein